MRIMQNEGSKPWIGYLTKGKNKLLIATLKLIGRIDIVIDVVYIAGLETLLKHMTINEEGKGSYV